MCSVHRCNRHPGHFSSAFVSPLWPSLITSLGARSPRAWSPSSTEPQCVEASLTARRNDNRRLCPSGATPERDQYGYADHTFRHPHFQVEAVLTLPNFASPPGANTSAAAGNWKAARMVAYDYAGAATELGAVKKYRSRLDFGFGGARDTRCSLGGAVAARSQHIRRRRKLERIHKSITTERVGSTAP